MSGLVYPHPSQPHYENWAVLGDFNTGSATLQSAHYDWLNYFAVTYLEKGGWVFIRGMASHKGVERRYDNLGLSRNRARAVQDHLLDKEQVLRRTPRYANHITRVDWIGDSRATGDSEDNNPFWRSVEVIATPYRQPPPEQPEQPKLPRTKPLPRPRYRIAVDSSSGVGPVSSAQVVIRDAWRHTEMQFDMNGLGVSATPFNLGRRGQFSTIPDDPHLRSLSDFAHANVELAGIELRGKDAQSPSYSASYLRIRPQDRRANTIVIRDFDTGESLLPDASASVLTLAPRSAESRGARPPLC